MLLNDLVLFRDELILALLLFLFTVHVKSRFIDVQLRGRVSMNVYSHVILFEKQHDVLH